MVKRYHINDQVKLYLKLAFTDEYGIKWTKKIPLAKYYHTLIEGVDINFLIKNNFLVPEKPFISENYKGKGLKVDAKTGEFSTETVNKVYDKKEAFEELSLLFENHAKGYADAIKLLNENGC